jgi:hypothetical protein
VRLFPGFFTEAEAEVEAQFQINEAISLYV